MTPAFSEPLEFDPRRVLARRGVQVQELPDVHGADTLSYSSEYCGAVVCLPSVPNLDLTEAGIYVSQPQSCTLDDHLHQLHRSRY
jgi:hypothetical protein